VGLQIHAIIVYGITIMIAIRIDIGIVLMVSHSPNILHLLYRSIQLYHQLYSNHIKIDMIKSTQQLDSK
jgi:hypothetical protein